MKPVELVLRHFGPYREEVTLDFSALQPLFLVAGPTGAGKTTLFDAMTYAIYGSALGSREKLASQFLSHHAPIGSEPSVRLTFVVGTTRWRVERKPPHRRQRTRGEGLVEVATSVKLEEFREGDWQEIKELPTALDRRLEDLIGLSDREFSRIIVLPQGEFQRFLEATAKDRSDMLEKLFPVEDYDRLAEAFKGRAATVRKQRDDLEIRYQALQEQRLQLGESRLALEEAVQKCQGDLAEAQSRWETLVSRAQQAQHRKEVGRQREAALALQRQLNARAEEMVTKRMRLQTAQQAQNLAPDYQRMQKAFEEGTRVRSALEALETEEKELLKKRTALANDFSGEVEVEREAERAALFELAAQARRWQELQSQLAAAVLASQACRRAENRAVVVAATLLGQRAKSLEEADLWSSLALRWSDVEKASHLRPGVPCPVCGSLSHPAPAQLPHDAPESLESVLGREKTAREAQETASNRFQALQALWGGPLPASLTSEPLPPELTSAEAFDHFLRDFSRVRSEEAAQRSVLSQGEPPADDPTADLKARQTALDRRSGAYKAWKVAVEQLEREQVRLQTSRRHALERREELLATYQQAKQTVDAGLELLGWTYAQLDKAALPEAEVTALRRELEDYETRKSVGEGEVRAREQDWAGLPPETPEPDSRLIAELRSVVEAHVQTSGRLAHQLDAWDQLETIWRSTDQQRIRLQHEADLVVPLSRTLDGDNARNLRLKTWVLVQYLDQVAQMASERLGILSGGRYRLRVQTEGLDGRSKWGLDLAVLDSQTGTERPVGTLSGGEKFMTSISLALGLADVIQARSGGVRLEALFIDEGFGSLDEQTLDRAMAVLHELGKNRTVGLISHVPELRNRIASRVDVVKGRNGSTLRQVGPSPNRSAG